MPKLIHHEEIEYDRALTYYGEPCTFWVNDPIHSGIKDDTGEQIFFDGMAYVVAVNTKEPSASIPGYRGPEHTVYIKFERNETSCILYGKTKEEETMTEVQKHLKLLGLKVQDKITGAKGVVASISFDLYGCIQAVITPEVTKDGKQQDSHWCDVRRLVVKGKKPVMEVPNFDFGPMAEGRKGPADKPAGHDIPAPNSH